jgi:hypothetical protein
MILGLRKNFHSGAKILFPIFIDKLKDKKMIDDV